MLPVERKSGPKLNFLLSNEPALMDAPRNLISSTYDLSKMSEFSRLRSDREESCPSSNSAEQVNELPKCDGIETRSTWSVPLSIDISGEKLLGHVNNPVAEDASIPREIIADELRSTRFLATLERPLRIGWHHKLPAYHLCFSLSFQNMQLSSGWRIRQASIAITFEDASVNTSMEDSSDDSDSDDIRPPAILEIHPKLYQGPVSMANVEVSTELSLSGGSLASVSLGGMVSQKRSWEQEGRLLVHGSMVGSPVRHKAVWRVSENPISKLGIPKEMRLVLIVRPQNGRRFLARLVLHASYGLWRGPLASMVPIVGKSDDPIYFDPTTLERMARQRECSQFDGKIIAEEVGDLAQCDLSKHSSFPSEESSSA